MMMMMMEEGRKAQWNPERPRTAGTFRVGEGQRLCRWPDRSNLTVVPPHHHPAGQQGALSRTLHHEDKSESG